MSEHLNQTTPKTLHIGKLRIFLIYILLFLASPTILFNSINLAWENSIEISEQVDFESESNEGEVDEDFEIFLLHHRALAKVNIQLDDLKKERSFKAEMPPLLETYTPPPEQQV